jgi:hypothetical protein
MLMAANLSAPTSPPPRSRRPTIAHVKTNTRLTILAVLSLGWLVLGVVNLVRSHVVVGVCYLVCAAIVTTLTLRLSRGRRSR